MSVASIQLISTVSLVEWGYQTYQTRLRFWDEEQHITMTEKLPQYRQCTPEWASTKSHHNTNICERLTALAVAVSQASLLPLVCQVVLVFPLMSNWQVNMMLLEVAHHMLQISIFFMKNDTNQVLLTILIKVLTTLSAQTGSECSSAFQSTGESSSTYISKVRPLLLISCLYRSMTT